LEAVAATTAIRLRGKYLVDLVAGDEGDDLYYEGGMRRLQRVQEATGVERLYVFDREFITRLDTTGAAIGDKQFQAESDRRELTRLFEDGTPASSILFEGVDGRPYKAGYAAVRKSDDEPEVVLALGVDAPADFFESLAFLRRQLVFYGLLLVLAMAAVAIFVGLRITRPVRSLAEAARQIGGGDWSDPIEVLSRDEIGLLASTMEKMRSDLRARDEHMQLMLGGIAHEVRNPLGGMELFSGILREELENDAEKRSHVQRIEKEIGHLKRVVEEFLEYARHNSSEFGPVKLHEVMQEVTDLEAARIRDAKLELALDSESVVCLGNAEQLRRVILNLLRNAIQAATEGVIEVKVWADKEARFSIRNQGPAIEEDVKSRLFEPFFTTKQKGTGLGLALVQKIVSDHGGAIEVQSDSAAGTCFTVSLPVANT
jgi:signal transduction histidine kinase